MNNQKAFDTLVNRLYAALEAEKATVAQAAAQGQFATVVAAGRRCEEIQAHLQNLEALRATWNSLVGENAAVSVFRAKKAKNKHLSPELKTPESAYCLPILRALVEMGGSGATDWGVRSGGAPDARSYAGSGT